jgi:hypothetical protein
LTQSHDGRRNDWIVWPNRAFNRTVSGGDLLKTCEGPFKDKVDEAASTNLCLGYIQGIQQFQHVFSDLRKVAPLFCEPYETGTYDQLRKVPAKWLKNNPEQLHRDARVVTTAAFMQAFPCQ